MKKYLLILILAFTVSCKNDNDPKTTFNAAYFTGYYQDNISHALTILQGEIEKEIQYIQDFQTSKSYENFKLMQSQWLLSAQQYSKAQLYNFGLIKERFFDTNIYNFPASVLAIENNVSENTVYSSDFLKKESTGSKGFVAMEYLLYGDNEHEAFQKLVDNDARTNYLEGVAKELLRQVELLIKTWENEYLDMYVNLDGNLCTSNAKCLTFNQIINILDITRVTKIGKAAGFEKSDQAILQNLQAYRSKSSLYLITAMLEEVQYVYFDSPTSLATVVNSIDNSGKISTEIERELEKISQLTTDFNTNLYDAIDNDPTTVQPIYDALNDLVVLFSVDVTSTLSLTVLPTDNDGD